MIVSEALYAVDLDGVLGGSTFVVGLVGGVVTLAVAIPMVRSRCEDGPGGFGIPAAT